MHEKPFLAHLAHFNLLVKLLDSKRGMSYYGLHCSCFILFLPDHTSLFMFHLISLSPHFIDHVSLFPSVHSPSHSFHLPQSISFMFTLFGCIHIKWSFNLIVSFTFQPIPSLEINDKQVSLDKFLILDIHYLKLTFGVFTTPCLFILSKKYNTHKLSPNCFDGLNLHTKTL